MSATLIVYPNKLNTDVFEEVELPSGVTFEAYLLDHVPGYSPSSVLFTAELNGNEFPTSFWSQYIIQDHDVIVATIEAKDPLTITMVVIAVVAAGAAIYAMNQVPDNYNSTTPDGSSIYSVNAQGNRPRMMGVIPEQAGKHKAFPDYLASPHYYYSANNRWLNILLAQGVGEYDWNIDDLYIGNTPISEYGSDINVLIKGPGESIAAHPAHRCMYTSPEVGSASSSAGLEIVGPLSISYTSTSTYIALTSDEVRLYQTLPWPIGSHFTVSGATNESEKFAGTVTFTDGGTDGNGDPLPDIISTFSGFDIFSVGHEVTFLGAGSNDGNFIISTVSATQMTLNDLQGNPVTNLTVGSGVYVQIFRTTSYDGKYRLVSKLGNGRHTVVKVNPADNTDDPTWTGFDPELVKPSGITLVLDEDDYSAGAIGPIRANPINQGSTYYELDFKFPRGLGRLNDNGGYSAFTVTIEIRYRLLGTTTWTVFTKSFVGATSNELAETVTFTLTEGEYEFECERVSTTEDNSQLFDEIEWTGLKCLISDKSVYDDITVICLSIKGNETLAANSENKISTIWTRKLPYKSAPAAPNRNIAPFFAHVIKDLGHSHSVINYEELDRLDVIWQTRGDTFDAIFDTGSTLFDVLKRVLAPGFAEPTLDYGQIIPVRDEPRTVFEQMYQPQNMLKGGLAQDIKLIDEDEPDGVEVEYFSDVTWKSETVMCTLPGDLAIKPEKVRAFGVTNRDKAWQFGMRKRRAKRYRRTIYSFNTEMDALNSSYLSYCALADDIPGYSQTGSLTDVNGNTLLLDQPVAFETGTHFIAVRKPDGSLSGVYTATAGTNEYEVVIDQALDFTPTFDGSIEPPFFMFGKAERWSHPVLITDINPSGTETVSVKAVNYDARIYDDDDNLAPT